MPSSLADIWRDLNQIAVESLVLGIVPVLRRVKVLMPKQIGTEPQDAYHLGSVVAGAKPAAGAFE